jgi:hypothetical protein
VSVSTIEGLIERASVSTRDPSIHTSHIPVVMRIMAVAALLLLLVSLAAATSNTSNSRERKRSEEETRRIFMEWKARHASSLTEEEEEHVYAFFKMDFCDNIDRRCDNPAIDQFSDHTQEE